MVGLPVPTAVESMPVGLVPGGGGQGCDTAQVRPRGLATDTIRVVTGGDQQDRGSVDPDTVEVSETCRGRSHERRERVIEPCRDGLEFDDLATQCA